jgi:hypothetical protein
MKIFELGQMLLGNSIQEYPVPREKWVSGPFEILCFNIHTIKHPYKVGDMPKSQEELEWEQKQKEEYLSQFYGSTECCDFSNDFFTIRSYYWGDDEDEMKKPNFEIPSENFFLTWYKYPFRGSYSSEKLNPKRWNNLIQKCIESLNS